MTTPERDARDERIRLLEYQTDYLREELAFVTRRYERVIYSVSWRLALPFRLIEGALRAVFFASRDRERSPPDGAHPGSSETTSNVGLANAAASHIAKSSPPSD